ncbi:MAG TPA: STAS domain-containing protein [Chloroflexota bacterium]|nr:STAS domain-containing protein [Chloroflexota bacterium]
MARAPVLRIGSTLVVTVLEDLHDRDALDLQTELLGQLERTGATGVLLDLSVVEIVDSFLGRMLNDIAVGVRLLGAQMVVVGIQPAVAITLVELGLELRGVRTAVSPDRGMTLLRRLVAVERSSWGRNDGLNGQGGGRADR